MSKMSKIKNMFNSSAMDKIVSSSVLSSISIVVLVAVLVITVLMFTKMEKNQVDVPSGTIGDVKLDLLKPKVTETFKNIISAEVPTYTKVLYIGSNRDVINDLYEKVCGQLATPSNDERTGRLIVIVPDEIVYNELNLTAGKWSNNKYALTGQPATAASGTVAATDHKPKLFNGSIKIPTGTTNFMYCKKLKCSATTPLVDATKWISYSEIKSKYIPIKTVNGADTNDFDIDTVIIDDEYENFNIGYSLYGDFYDSVSNTTGKIRKLIVNMNSITRYEDIYAKFKIEVKPDIGTELNIFDSTTIYVYNF